MSQLHSAAFLSYIFMEGTGILGHAIFDILVGIFQGAPPSPVVFPLVQGIPLIASEPGRYGGLVLTMQDDSIAIFRGATEADSRDAAGSWLREADRWLKSFNLSLNPKKMVAVSLQASGARVAYPSEQSWARSLLALGNDPIPLALPIPWAAASLPSVPCFGYLGREVWPRDLAGQKRLGIFGAAAKVSASFEEHVCQILNEVKAETAGQPVLMAIKVFNERLSRAFYGLLPVI